MKYYKGLGTSSDKEIKNTFGKKLIYYLEDIHTDANMNKVFLNKFSEDNVNKVKYELFTQVYSLI